MDWLPTLRLPSHPRVAEWQTQGTRAWLLNQNVAPVDKVFLSCTLQETPAPNQTEIAVQMNEENLSAEFRVDRQLLFPALSANASRDAFRDDLAAIPVVSNAEVFFYLSDRLRKKDRFFYCGSDLFSVNDWDAYGPSAQLKPEELRAANQKAVDWLFKEELLKTDFAHPSMFVAEVLKRFIWTSEQQAIFLCGETGSGKTSNFPLVLQAITHYNQSSFDADKVESLKAHRASVARRVSKLEAFIHNNENETMRQAGSILPTQDTRSRQNSAVSQQRKSSVRRSGSVPRGSRARNSRASFSVSNKPDVYAQFNREVEKAVVIANLFVQIYHGDDNFSNAGCLKLLLEADQKAKFVGFTLSIHALHSFRVTEKGNGNFAFFYAMLAALSDEERATLRLEASPQRYSMLQVKGKPRSDLPAFAGTIKALREVLGSAVFGQVARVTAAILKLGNMRNSIQESKPLFNDVHKILDFRSSELFTYLMMDKSGMVLKTPDFLERAECLMEALLCSLVHLVLTALNDNDLSRNKEKLGARPALHLVDAAGFNDVGAEAADLEGRSNGFSELAANYFYEHFLSFFNANRFGNLEKMREEGTEAHFVPVDFVDNAKTIQNLQSLVQELGSAATFMDFFNAVSRLFGAFDIDSLKKLIPGAPHENADARKVTSIEHSFAQFYNYNLMSIFRGNHFRNTSGITQLLRESPVLETWELVSPARRKSRMAKQAEEVGALFDGLRNANVFFFFCLKVPPSRTISDRRKEIFRQLRGVDFEALVRFHQTAFPYKVNYRFFIEKFNVENKVRQIEPTLNVDFPAFVQAVLRNAFGQNREDLYAFGHTNLFIRANFYQEINGMLKETGARQRLLVFVERALADLLATHVDNSDKVVRLAQTFLVNYCSSNKFQAIKRAKEKVVRLFRRWKKRKEATAVSKLILADMLNTFEYYNLKKVTKIQAIWRGRIVRKVMFPVECQLLAARIFQRKAERVRTNILNTWESMLTCRAIIDKQNNLRQVSAALCAVTEVQRRMMGIRVSRKVIGVFLRSFLTRLGIRAIRIERFRQGYLGRKILRFLRDCMVKVRRHYKEVQEEQQRQLREHTAKVDEFQNALQRACAANNLESLPAQNVLPARDEVGKTKASFYMQVLSVAPLEKELPAAFASNFAANLSACYKEDLLKLELSDNELLLLSQKQRLVVQKLHERKQIEFRLPTKVERVGFYEDSFLFLEENGIMKGKPLTFEPPNPSSNLDGAGEEDTPGDRVFEFTKVSNFLTRGYDVCGSTVCRKVFYKSDRFENPSVPRVSQMKRPITQLALGANFMMMLDETGVVYAVGDNVYGQLGLGHCQNTSRIQVVKRFVEAKEIVRNIAAGHSHCLASTQSNRVFGWGDNSWYQLSFKSKNYRLRFVQPRDLTAELRPDLNARIQVYCGRQSSYLLSSSMRLVTLGRVTASQQVVKAESRKVLPNLPKGVSVVGLDVRWNDYVEIVLLKVVDFRHSAFDKVAHVTNSSSALFDHFLRSPGTSLFGYSETLAKYLPLPVLATKIVDAKNRNENQRLEKMTESLLCLK